MLLTHTQTTGLDGRVKALKDEFGARTREAETLRSGLERAQGTLDKAQSLIGQLGGEQV
jgi:dynein heavy chain 2, cytosolic